MASRLTLSIEAYHRDRAWFTNTALKHAAKWTKGGILWTPSHLRSYLDGCAPIETSPALEFGSAFHAVAEGKVLEEVCAIMPQVPDEKTGELKDMTRAMNAYKKEWRPAIDEKFGRDFPDMSRKESEKLRACWDSLRDSPAVRKLLEQKVVAREGTIRWEQGLQLQVRPDLELEDDGFDWKTSSNPHGFLWSAYDFGYHRSAALQKQGIYEASGKWKPFYHVVVGNVEPFDIVVHELPERDLDLGMRENLRLMSQVRDWMESGMWESEWEYKIVRKGLPAWAHTRSEEAAIDDEFGGSDE